MDGQLQTYLVLILSIGFFVLLVLSIIVVFSVIMILRRIQRLTAKVEIATDDLSETLRTVGKKIAPVAITTLVGAAVKRWRSK